MEKWWATMRCSPTMRTTCRRRTTPSTGEGDVIGVYRAGVVTAAPGMVQFFAEGVAHCLFQPILEWCEGKLAEASNKQTRWRYGTIKKKVVAYMDKYKYQGRLPREWCTRSPTSCSWTS